MRRDIIMMSGYQAIVHHQLEKLSLSPDLYFL